MQTGSACSSGRICPAATTRSPRREAQYFRELKAEIDNLRNHPSIVMWVPFNEGLGPARHREVRRVAEGGRSYAPRQQRQRLDRHERRRRRRPALLSRPRDAAAGAGAVVGARRVRRSRTAARRAHLGRQGQLGLSQLHVARRIEHGVSRSARAIADAARGRSGGGHLHADDRLRDRGQRRDDLRPRRRQTVGGVSGGQPHSLHTGAARHTSRRRFRSRPANMALHHDRAGRRLVRTGVRCGELERRPRRLRREGHAIGTGRHRVEDRRHLAAAHR